MKRFLIIQTAFLGDVILATPVISELKRLYPSATIDVLVRKGNEGILLNHPSIRQVFTLDKQQGKWKEIRKLVRTFRVEKYDELINLQRFGSSGLISFLSG
ncbi:MAG TPA: glycosyltransferase family 9 protein, partial [Fluviicola sp.]|nr:glycosyltransferase family 9 protein [Fluviicola sp.]